MISTELSTLNVFSTLDRHLNMISTETLNVFIDTLNVFSIYIR